MATFTIDRKSKSSIIPGKPIWNHEDTGTHGVVYLEYDSHRPFGAGGSITHKRILMVAVPFFDKARPAQQAIEIRPSEVSDNELRAAHAECE